MDVRNRAHPQSIHVEEEVDNYVDDNNNNNNNRNGSIEKTIQTYRAEHVNITQITKQAAYRSAARLYKVAIHIYIYRIFPKSRKASHGILWVGHLPASERDS